MTNRLALATAVLMAGAYAASHEMAGQPAATPAAGDRISREWAPPSAPAPAADLVPREPCAHHDPLRQAFFGDLHTHTSFSLDALGRGGFQTPDDAYRFARGEPIGLAPLDAEGNPTQTAQLDRPLDFAAVTDHSEWLGEIAVCTDPTSPAYDETVCRGVRPGFTPEERAAWQQGGANRGAALCGDDGQACREGLLTAWGETRTAAERHYDRSADCAFTTFLGWEYTRAPDRSMTHRNIILRNEIAPELPISWIDAARPDEMWAKLKARCNDNGSGCEAMSIPHNPNISNGRMFTLDADASLEELQTHARLRAEMEPLVEMMQAKGASECRRGMWNVVGGEDELCDFEQARFIAGAPPEDCEAGTGVGALRGEGCQSRLDFARYVLIEGLAQEERLGINPFRLGFIAATDGHNGAPGDTDEQDFPGANSMDDHDLETRLTNASYVPHRLRNPGGLVGVWAEENSRDAIFDALKRRETFGTSGPRIQVRLFGGYDLPPLCESETIAEAYERAVPMGGVLPEAVGAEAPMFFVSALADPGTSDHPGTPLQRIQIVKGWVGEDGRFHERVFDVAGDPDNGATVSRDTCAQSGSGATSLCTVWTDPEFEAGSSAVYYARVLENPSCRWNGWQCAARSPADRPAQCQTDEIPWEIQERAWSSPIWYRATAASE